MSQNRRESDRPSGYSYLDGVPVKIGEKFRPPRKVTLPLNYQQRCPVDLLNDEYDFSLENQVLELANTKRRGKEAAERAKTEKLGSTIEEFTRLIDGTKACEDDFWTTRIAPPVQQNEVVTTDIADLDVGNSFRNRKEETLSSATDNVSAPKAAILEPNAMLKPILLESGVSVKPDVTIIASESLNLADFESESSPFDNMALKTLNDLEELRSVLQNNTVRDGQNRSCRDTNDQCADSGVFTRNSNLVGGDTVYTVASLPDVNNLRTIHQSTYNDDKITAVPPRSISSAIPASTTWSVPSIEPFSSDSIDVSHDADPPNLPPQPVSISQAVAPCPSSKCSLSEDLYAALVPPSSSRSTPDLLKELGVALATERERKRASILPSPLIESPQEPSGTSLNTEVSCRSQGFIHASTLLTDENKVANEGMHITGNSNLSTVAVDMAVLSGSDADNLALINHIADMGFPKSRVVRAIQKLGADDKKLVEHLCMVQSFIEAGHSAQDAEMSLFLHDHNEIEAKTYLELMSQFKDLGFEEDRIKNALLQSKNDRDKTLDILVSE